MGDRKTPGDRKTSVSIHGTNEMRTLGDKNLNLNMAEVGEVVVLKRKLLRCNSHQSINRSHDFYLYNDWLMPKRAFKVTLH
ncbi:hypothetical protein DPMN_178907 [Dreissena polymorpha]|uniref:Uncharacterized protein n=1 Tax=Dreissena polymorpha TaxID=45954 RepID=A0A9D4EDM9_DREPO|nr:hypothetical protein DPMN_178907 [Dreissena polymorpha]